MNRGFVHDQVTVKGCERRVPGHGQGEDRVFGRLTDRARIERRYIRRHERLPRLRRLQQLQPPLRRTTTPTPGTDTYPISYVLAGAIVELSLPAVFLAAAGLPLLTAALGATSRTMRTVD